MPTPQDVRKKGSNILKLPMFAIVLHLQWQIKLVVIIKSLKVPKIKKSLLYEMKFLVPNYSCLQNPWLVSYRPQIPVLSVLCPLLNLLNPPPPNKNPGYATGLSPNPCLRGRRLAAWATARPHTYHTNSCSDGIQYTVLTPTRARNTSVT
jgi:hypothetical protein